MKILFISTDSPDISIGGVERHIKNLIDFCVQHSLKTVFLLPAPNNIESSEKMKDVQIIKTNFLNFHQKNEVSQNEINENSKGFFELLNWLIKEEDVNIIGAHNFHLSIPSYSIVLSMISFLWDIPIILIMHSFMMNELQQVLVRDISWKKIFGVSKSVTADCFNRGIEINRLRTQYFGVNTKEFRANLDKTWLKDRLKLPEKSKIILHASRIIEGMKYAKEILKAKGIVTLVEAFSSIFSSDPTVKLVIAIASPPKKFNKEFNQALEKLRGYIQLHNVEGGVILKEFKMEEMPLVYNGADVFVMASENETFGQVYIEAMACGVPVIGTNVGGIPEVITDNFNGFLVEPNNPSILTQKIEELLYNENQKKEFILTGLRTVRRKFSTDRQFNLLFTHLYKLVPKDKIYEFKSKLNFR